MTWNKYDATAARKHGKPGRESRPKSLTLDIHSHVAIPAAGKIAGPHIKPETVPLGWFSNDETKAVNAKQDADIPARIAGESVRLEDLDKMGLDKQLVMPPPGQCWYNVPTKIAIEATRVLNDGLGEFASKRADRYLALGSVPFTLSSNLLAAVRVALELPQGDARFKAIAETAEGMRERLRDLGLEPLVGDSGSSPAVTTIELATQSLSRRTGERLRERGVHVSFESGYLLPFGGQVKDSSRGARAAPLGRRGGAGGRGSRPCVGLKIRPHSGLRPPEAAPGATRDRRALSRRRSTTNSDPTKVLA